MAVLKSQGIKKTDRADRSMTQPAWLPPRVDQGSVVYSTLIKRICSRFFRDVIRCPGQGFAAANEGRGCRRRYLPSCHLLEEDATSRSIAPATGNKISLPARQLCPLHKGGFSSLSFESCSAEEFFIILSQGDSQGAKPLEPFQIGGPGGRNRNLPPGRFFPHSCRHAMGPPEAEPTGKTVCNTILHP